MSDEASEYANPFPNDPPAPGVFGEPLTVTHALYSPGRAKAAPNRPLFVCLHGWGANEEDMADIMQYLAPHNDYVSLRAPLVLDDTQRAYAWLHRPVPHSDDLDRDAFAAATAVDTWISNNVDASREIVPIGFSQGALVASHVLRINPERYRAAVILSGFIADGKLEGTAPQDEYLATLNIPVFYGYGEHDRVIPRCEFLAATAWLEEHTWLKCVNYRQLDHAVSLQEFADIRQWLQMNNLSSGIL